MYLGLLLGMLNSSINVLQASSARKTTSSVKAMRLRNDGKVAKNAMLKV